MVPGAGEKKTQDEHFSDDVRGFRQCVWSVRFYAVSTTWTSSLLPCPPPPAPVPSELPWQREEAGHTARLIFGQCKQGDADLCKITQRFRLLRWETRKWIFTDRMTQILGSWEDLRYKSVSRVEIRATLIFFVNTYISIRIYREKAFKRQMTQHSLSIYILGNICGSYHMWTLNSKKNAFSFTFRLHN